MSNKSYVTNCIINKPREGGNPLFEWDKNGVLTTRLNGYAIMPVEEYCKLTGETPTEEMKAKIEEFNQSL